MDLFYNSTSRLKAITIPFAKGFIKMISQEEDADLVRETELLVNNYLNYVVQITLWAIGGQDPLQVRTAPILFHPNVQSMTMNEEEIKNYVTAYNQCVVSDPCSLTSSWIVVFLHNLSEGVYILEFSVHNQDRDSDDPSFITPRIIGELLDDAIQIYQHAPSIRCYEFTLIIPLMLIAVDSDVERVNLFIEHSPHLVISHINLIKLRHRSGRWIDVTE